MFSSPVSDNNSTRVFFTSTMLYADNFGTKTSEPLPIFVALKIKSIAGQYITKVKR